MSRIGIVTFFKSYNYGVWLQAYATQTALEELGHSVEIINYANPLEEQKFKYCYKEGGKIRGYITSFFKSLLFGKVRYYKKAFGKHLNSYYHISAENYHNYSEMSEIQYDILVAGSDQIWSPDTTNGELDLVFLLRFGKADKRVSIASSIGSKQIRNQDIALFKEAFKYFDAISVREEFAKKELQPLTKIPIQVIADPTFLIKKDMWEVLIKEKATYLCEEKKYILTYFVSEDKRSERFCNMIQGYIRKFKLPVWCVQFSTYKNKDCDKKVVGATMADFLKLIKHARLVITDSFHGTVLSANLNTDFVVIENKKNPERVRNILDKLGLLERINLVPDKYSDIEFSVVNKRIEKIHDDSLNWIKETLRV
ncbi:polysaccharide pyruvyl transferase family protein [Blautia sp. MSJ-9]|uniref:polysaccharide pyruvyl transferase family protein n=1 Tax=Blautia sp. MSJ-9 TaxID=2841511 RepID=UPI001C125F14|nr:polysaccharide pyruvyl transferase family protein [Blautia sp. MSJ-9]MBU5681117.1 polysaccharide pyruvyl transferase family protein [Blautia sp. MSJ-9]